MWIRGFLNWFSGGPDGYMTLVHCMNHDYFWIWITVALDFAVAAGYVLIAKHWWENERLLRDSPAKSALQGMKNIFILCGICGYLFIPIKMFWPAWRLYDAFLAVLAYSTWRYALRSRELSVVYNELGRSERLAVELQESQEEGRRKSHFLNALSHDLKTPLNGLTLQTELAVLNLESNDPEGMRDALAQIKICARTTAELLNSFLELGRLDWSREPVQIEDVGACRFLTELADRSRARALSKGLTLTVEAPGDLCVRTDRVKLGRVLENLLDNALKFSHEGGVRLTAEVTVRGVALSVVDTGPGIAAVDQSRIFEDFVQVQNRERDSRKGFGLGLAIARRLAHQLGGVLAVQSEPGRGSRFTILYPPGAARLARPGPGHGHPADRPASASG